MKPARLREADRRDIDAMHRVRLAVRENRLASAIGHDDYVRAIETTGRGWVVEDEGRVAGFAVANARTGNIWALFVDPAYERRGFGRRLHDTMLHWLFSTGADRAWLSTQPGTRAERFYEAAGWRRTGINDNGELEFELRREAFEADLRADKA